MIVKAVLILILIFSTEVNSIFLHFQEGESMKQSENSYISYKCTRIYTPGISQRITPILLLHGLGGSIHNWDNIFDDLASQTGRRICAIDVRNHGDSFWDNDMDVAAMASDVGSFLNSQSISKINIIGHSLGGKIAVHYTLNNPERVSSIVVEDMRPNGITSESLTLVQDYVRIFRVAIGNIPDVTDEKEVKQFIASYNNEKSEQFGTDQATDNASAEKLPIRSLDGKCYATKNFDLLQNIDLTDPLAYLTESKGLYIGPALFIFGTKSPFKVGDDKDEILKLFCNAKFVPVKDAEHDIHVRFPEIFMKAVVELLHDIE